MVSFSALVIVATVPSAKYIGIALPRIFLRCLGTMDKSLEAAISDHKVIALIAKYRSKI